MYVHLKYSVHIPHGQHKRNLSWNRQVGMPVLCTAHVYIAVYIEFLQQLEARETFPLVKATAAPMGLNRSAPLQMVLQIQAGWYQPRLPWNRAMIWHNRSLPAHSWEHPPSVPPHF